MTATIDPVDPTAPVSEPAPWTITLPGDGRVLRFEVVDPEDHADLLYDWMHQPHVAPWWGADRDLDQTVAYIRRQRASGHLVPWIVSHSSHSSHASPTSPAAATSGVSRTADARNGLAGASQAANAASATPGASQATDVGHGPAGASAGPGAGRDLAGASQAAGDAPGAGQATDDGNATAPLGIGAATDGGDATAPLGIGAATNDGNAMAPVGIDARPEVGLAEDDDDGRRHWIPFGYTELYRAAEDPLAEFFPLTMADRGWHVFVGPPEVLGSGLPRLLGRAVLARLLSSPGVERVVCEPNEQNGRMLAFCRALGYESLGTVDLPDKRAALLACTTTAFDTRWPGDRKAQS
jgi:RimJ/RimL family protein N-acetyltransferase